MRRLLAVTTFFLASPSALCAQRTQSYNLVSVGGGRLPTVVVGNDAGRVDIVAGSLILRSDGSYTQRETRRSFPSKEATKILGEKSVSNTYTRDSGKYLVRDTVIIFTPYATDAADEVPYSGSIRDTGILFSSGGSDYVYRRRP